jgi:hypothetical protein
LDFLTAEKEKTMQPQVPPNTFEIFTGDDKTMFMKILYGPSLGPVDLSSCTEIKVALPNADGTFTNLLLSLAQVVIASPAVLGKFSALIPSAKSALLNPGVLQDVDVTFTISGSNRTVRFLQALSVLEA